MRLRHTLALLLLFTASASAQTSLTVGEAVEGTLATGDAAVYTLALEADRFVAGAADQQTVDVVVTVTAPDGAEIGRFDGPGRGPEPFQFEAEAGGTYTLTITPFEDQEGTYALAVDLVEPLATTPEGTVRQMMYRFDREGTPGAVVAVIASGATVFQEAYGLADLTHGVPYTTSTPTNIGSTSKQVTAAAVALLAERGALSLDDDVRDYIPELKDFGPTVTLRHLLTHTSGYREFLNTLLVAGRRLDEGDAIDREEIVRIIERQPELQNAPGAEWNYNNSGFALLTLVVERVDGRPFDRFVAEELFAPLGMDRSTVRTSPLAIVPGRARGYTRGEGGMWQETPDLGGAMGAGGVYTTAEDLARWIAGVHLGDAFPGVTEALTTEYVLADGDSTGYGLGLFLAERGGQRWVHHGGADNAHRSAFHVYPDLDAAVVVLTNAPADVDALAIRAADAFFEGAFETGGEGAEAEPVAEADEAFDPSDFDDALFDAYAGRFALAEAPNFILEFRRDGDGGYETQATGQPAVEIVPTSDSTFALTVVEAGVTFHREADGSVRSITLHQNGDHAATRVEAEAPDFADFEGRYLSDEIETFYTLLVEDDALVLRHLRAGDQDLAHVAGDRFSLGGATLAFERDADGAVTAFTVDIGRARDIRFERVE